MTKRNVSVFAIVTAVLLSAGAAIAANPGTANRTTPGTANFSATSGSRFVNAILTGEQHINLALSNVGIRSRPWGRNTDSYSGSTQIRCNGSATIHARSFSYPSTTYSVSCNEVGNAFAGVLWIN